MKWKALALVASLGTVGQLWVGYTLFSWARSHLPSGLAGLLTPKNVFAHFPGPSVQRDSTQTLSLEVRNWNRRDGKWLVRLRAAGLGFAPWPVKPFVIPWCHLLPPQAMARDEKNYYQDTPKQIRNKINVYKRFYPEEWQAFVDSLPKKMDTE